MKIKYTILKAIYSGLLAGGILFATSSVFAQVKVGDNPTMIAAGSALEIESGTKGLRFPQLPLTSTIVFAPVIGTGTAITSPGMAVYNTNAAIISGTGTNGKLYESVGLGLYYWDGFGWVGNNSTAVKTEYLQQMINTPYNVTPVPGSTFFRFGTGTLTSTQGNITIGTTTVTLKPGKVYRLTFNPGSITSLSGGPVGFNYRWYDVTNSQILGNSGYAIAPSGGVTGNGANCEYIVAPIVETTYSVICAAFSGGGAANIGTYTWSNVTVFALP